MWQPDCPNTLNPNDADAFSNRGHAYYAKGQYDRAMRI
ncbi:tetratricopeptide repeat protein [Bradyrhizobium sp. 186]|nr:tetratricopeptide repeat protein [Bradyrhizobium sp. 186]